MVHIVRNPEFGTSRVSDVSRVRSRDGKKLGVAFRTENDKLNSIGGHVDYVCLFENGVLKSVNTTLDYSGNHKSRYEAYSDVYTAVYETAPPSIPDIDKTPYVISSDGALIVQIVEMEPLDVSKTKLRVAIPNNPKRSIQDYTVLYETQTAVTRVLHCRDGDDGSIKACFMDQDGIPCLLLEDEDKYFVYRLQNTVFVLSPNESFLKPKSLLWIQGYYNVLDIDLREEWISVGVDRGVFFPEFAVLVQRNTTVQRKVAQQSFFYSVRN